MNVLRLLVLTAACLGPACTVQTDPETSSDALSEGQRGSPYVARGPSSCDDAEASFFARGVRPFLTCATRGSYPGFVVKFARVDPSTNRGREVRQEICFKSAPDKASVAHYAVNVEEDDASFEVVARGFHRGDIFLEAPSYRVSLGPVEAGYRYGTLDYGSVRLRTTCFVHSP